MNIIDALLLIILFGFMPIGFMIFGKTTFTGRKFVRMIGRYKWTILFLYVLFAIKNVLDLLNDPVRDVLGLDFTDWIYRIEGDAPLHIQQGLMNEHVTAFFVIVYLIGYLFLFYFSFLLFAYVDKRKLANKIMFANLMVTLISVPLYLFFPIFVTSWPAMDHSLDPNAPIYSGIQGMQPIMYHFHPSLQEFFYAKDPFDNCVPSLHVAVPLATMYLIVKHRDGHRFKGYTFFLGTMIVLISIAIVYLGIHWIIDILAGVLIIIPALMLTERYSERFWFKLYGILEPAWWNRIRRRPPKPGESWYYDLKRKKATSGNL